MITIAPGRPLLGQLIYSATDFAFDTEPHPEGGFASLLINDIQIEIDEDGTLLYVWGYCPMESWVPSSLSMPHARIAQLRLETMDLDPGTSIRLNPDARWPILFDTQAQQVCTGDATATEQAIEFAPGACAVIASGSLLALWLSPKVFKIGDRGT